MLILGSHSRTVTDLSPTDEVLSDVKKVVKAYTLLGEEIPDYAHYSGLAIVQRKDGTRSKIYRP